MSLIPRVNNTAPFGFCREQSTTEYAWEFSECCIEANARSSWPRNRPGRDLLDEFLEFAILKHALLSIDDQFVDGLFLQPFERIGNGLFE